MPDAAVICECFARDGLQHEERFIDTADKVALIDAFTRAGFSRIEATSYSNPARVPAFRDASEVLASIQRRESVFYKATCANLRSVQRALADADAGIGVNEISLLVSATERHTEVNLHSDRRTQWENVKDMVRASGGRFRLIGSLSVAFGCPFEGAVDPGAVIDDVARFAELGVRHVSLADTTGLATPRSVKSLFDRMAKEVPEVTGIAHFHNTRGLGLANCLVALEAGCRFFDSSFGGVGGHPAQIHYGDGLSGNVATEDLVNLLEGLGVSTGLDLDAMTAASRLCEEVLGRELDSMVARTGFGLFRHLAGANEHE